MSWLGIAQGVGSILGGIGGLFGGRKKQKTMSPAESMVSQAKGARWASDEYGFNPLTMLQYGQPGAGAHIGMGGGGAPPLASIDLITGGLAGLDDVLSGDKARRRAADQLELDIAKIKLDQARSGVLLPPPPSAVAAPGVPFGARPATHAQVTARPAPARMASGKGAWLDPSRQVEREPVSNTGGFIQIQNRVTNGPVNIPGDGGEPWGWDENLMAGLWAAPQVIWNTGRKAIDAIDRERKKPTKPKDKKKSLRSGDWN